MDRGMVFGLTFGMVALLIAPAFAGLVARQRKAAGWGNFAFCGVAGLTFVGLGAKLLLAGPELGAAHSMAVDLGFARVPFLLDGFSALFLGLISLLAVTAAFYSIEYLEHYAQYSVRSYYVSYPLFFLGMVGMVTTDDLTIGLSLSWQLMTIASFFLIRFDYHEAQNVRIANRYLLLMELAWLLIVGGAMLIPNAAIGDSLHELGAKLGLADFGLRTAVYGFLLVGFAFKAGVFPLGQLWLPDAHSVAPSPISAVLSGVMIKTGVYGIARTLFWMLPAGGVGLSYDGRGIAIGVAVLGVVTLFVGTSQAVKQNDAKRLHAYSSIGQIGYIVLGLGCALFFHYSDGAYSRALVVLAFVGAIYHTLNHGVFKGLLFLSTGSVQYATGTKDLNSLGGLIRLMPLTTALAAIAAAAVAGVPAFSGFISKWGIVSSALLAGKESPIFSLFGVIALMTSAMTLATYVKFFGLTFTGSGIEWSGKKAVREVPGLMLAPKALLAAICVAQGLLPFAFLGLLMRAFRASEGSLLQELFSGAAGTEVLTGSAAGLQVMLPGAEAVTAVAMPVAILLIFGVGLAFAQWLRRAGGASERSAAVWLCGYQQLNGLNRYGSDGMYAAFKNFMKWTGGNVK